MIRLEQNDARQTPTTRLIDEHAKCVARIAELEALLLTALALHGGHAHTYSEIEWRDAARKALGLKRS